MKKARFMLALGFAAALTAVGVSSATNESATPAAAAAPDRALIRCGTTRTVGFLGPFTGPAASLGAQQRRWFRYYVIRYNARNRNKIRVVEGDTKLGGPVSEAVKAAQFLVGNSSILGVVGPSGSQEVEATTATLRNAGLGFVSGSATRTTLTTDGKRRGYFFRSVPPDAVQSTSAANYIRSVLNARRVYIIDDQETYSTGLANEVQAKLRAGGVEVTRDSVNQQQSDFSSLIAKIPRDTQLVYLPWQLPPRGQAFGRQMAQAGRGSIRLMGADGLYDPAFSSVGSNVYTSAFPINPRHAVLRAYLRSHGNQGDFFGAPTYVAVQVVVEAINRACRNGDATRAEVRREIARTRIRTSLLGLPIRFNRGGDISGGRFGIYRSQNGTFQPVG